MLHKKKDSVTAEELNIAYKIIRASDREIVLLDSSFSVLSISNTANDLLFGGNTETASVPSLSETTKEALRKEADRSSDLTELSIPTEIGSCPAVALRIFDNNTILFLMPELSIIDTLHERPLLMRRIARVTCILAECIEKVSAELAKHSESNTSTFSDLQCFEAFTQVANSLFNKLNRTGKRQRNDLNATPSQPYNDREQRKNETSKSTVSHLIPYLSTDEGKQLSSMIRRLIKASNMLPDTDILLSPAYGHISSARFLLILFETLSMSSTPFSALAPSEIWIEEKDDKLDIYISLNIEKRPYKLSHTVSELLLRALGTERTLLKINGQSYLILSISLVGSYLFTCRRHTALSERSRISAISSGRFSARMNYDQNIPISYISYLYNVRSAQKEEI